MLMWVGSEECELVVREEEVVDWWGEVLQWGMIVVGLVVVSGGLS